MKFIKSFLLAFVLIAFVFIQQPKAQGVVGVITHDYGTVSNSVDESYITYRFAGLLKQFGCTKIDSMIISLTVANETDIDSLMWYPCNFTSSGTVVKGTVITHTVTLNVAASGTGTERLFVSDHGIQAASFRGYEGFTLFTRGATAGNDATDPNSLRVSIAFYGS